MGKLFFSHFRIVPKIALPTLPIKPRIYKKKQNLTSWFNADFIKAWCLNEKLKSTSLNQTVDKTIFVCNLFRSLTLISCCKIDYQHEWTTKQHSSSWECLDYFCSESFLTLKRMHKDLHYKDKRYKRACYNNANADSHLRPTLLWMQKIMNEAKTTLNVKTFITRLRTL